ncbi:MAG: hypothetical protein R6U10_06710 [Thermoplasmatota archaeon]
MVALLSWMKYYLQSDSDKCPRCGGHPFEHGFTDSNQRHFCTRCGFGWS